MGMILRSSRHLVRFGALSGLIVLLIGCDSGVSDRHEKAATSQGLMITPLPSRSAIAGSPLFTHLNASETGIAFQNNIDLNHPLKRLYHSGFACGGVAIGDLNGDNLPEIFLASGPGSNKLYYQTSAFQFEDVTSSAGVSGGERWAAGVALVDIDDDGDLDIYVCNYDSPNELFVNESSESKFVFREAAADAGLDLVDACLMPSFCDYDQDGDLDCWILTNRLYREGGRPAQPPFERDASGKVRVKAEFARYYGLVEKAPGKYTMDDVGRPDYLLRNDGGKFVDVSAEAGIRRNGFGLSATWWDYDEDGLTDIYVCNDFLDPDQLFRNNGDGTFTDVITETVNATSWYSMGSDVGDINHDGRLDFVVLDMAATTHYKSKIAMGEMGSLRWQVEAVQPRQLMRNMCYLSTGTNRLIETASLSGIASTDWSWAAKLADFDNDGRVDLFVSNGMTRNFNHSDLGFEEADLIGKTQWDLYEHTPKMPEQNLAFQNRGGLEFDDVSRDWGLDHTGISYGAAYGDLDRDGDLDLVVVNLDEPVSLYRNNGTDNQAVVIQLEGAAKNSRGIGAVVRAQTSSGVEHIRQMMPTTGFLSSNDPELVIGLGQDTKLAKLTVAWPAGSLQRFENLEAGNRYVIREAEQTPPPAETKRSQPLFKRSKVLDGLVHRETPFEDFDRQLLLPNKLSQLGPGMAWGDVDGDGDDDLYAGAARGVGGAVLINEGLGTNGVCRFSLPSAEPFLSDAEQENMGALFFDADGDGDLDLYVANGSYEYEENDPRLEDRLYLNQGNGRFTKALEALPDFRDVSSCVVGADFDRDGDVDLFVGGRVIPGKYPETPHSRLLLNGSVKGGTVRFAEAPDTMAPGLRSAGMVTSALWSDVDHDGWLDLLVTCEWGPVKYFRNEQGKLIEQTEAANLANRLGWWNSIAGADIDHDGDIDYAVGNFGLNTKYHASEKKPALLYYGDYAGDGTKCLVEAKYESNVLLPVRGKSCSSHAMPHLAERYKTFHEFAQASLTEIYTPAKLDDSLTLSANMLESGILINDGKGRFRFQPLPPLVQVAPAFGLCFLDANADGHADLFMAQNFFTPQFETGPYSSGLSVLLLGNGASDFTALMPDVSGIVIPGDAKSAALVDLNQDGHLDLAVAQNNGPLLTFESTRERGEEQVRVHLAGTNIFGARVSTTLTSGRTIHRELYGGSGYLSQSTSRVVLNLGSDSLERLSIRWPNGEVSELEEPTPTNGLLKVARPAQ